MPRFIDEFANLSKNAPELVFHYTGSAGLKGILQKRHIWATSALHASDSQEVRYTIKTVRNVIQDRMKQSDKDE